MVGGSAEALATAMPILNVIGSTVVHMGGVGTGQVAKACNQLVVAANLQGLAEAIALARAAGIIDPSRLLTAMAGGLANSRVLELSGPRMLSRDYEPGGKAAFHLRDLRHTRSAALACDVELPALDLMIEVFERLVATGLGDRDHAAILALLEPGAPPPIRKSSSVNGGDDV
jgi:2-hydroxy-3-oxopropionate reductase